MQQKVITALYFGTELSYNAIGIWKMHHHANPLGELLYSFISLFTQLFHNTMWIM
jgi:hypothetical protein